MSTSGFIGFGRFAASESGVGARETSINEPLGFYEGQDNDIRVILSRLSKKDATTKRKALQDWHALIPTLPASVLRPALPHWFYLYQKLTFDPDRKVREGTQHCLVQLVRKLKRAYRLYLVHYFPYWWCAMHDSVDLDIAKYAEDAYKVAFAQEAEGRQFPSRLESAWIQFCLEHSNEDAAVLQALAAYISRVKRLDARLSKNQTLWKMVYHSDPLFRRAMYRVMAAITQDCADFDPNTDHLGKHFVGLLNEKDASNHNDMWTAVLLALRRWPDLCREAHFFTKLYALFRHGMYGSGAASYLSVAPLILLIPKEMVTAKLAATLVNEIWKGRRDARGADNAIVECFAECAGILLCQTGDMSMIHEVCQKVDQVDDNVEHFGMMLNVLHRPILMWNKTQDEAMHRIVCESNALFWKHATCTRSLLQAALSHACMGSPDFATAVQAICNAKLEICLNEKRELEWMLAIFEHEQFTTAMDMKGVLTKLLTDFDASQDLVLRILGAILKRVPDLYGMVLTQAVPQDNLQRVAQWIRYYPVAHDHLSCVFNSILTRMEFYAASSSPKTSSISSWIWTVCSNARSNCWTTGPNVGM